VNDLVVDPHSKSGGVHPPCGFDSHLRHHSTRPAVARPRSWQAAGPACPERAKRVEG